MNFGQTLADERCLSDLDLFLGNHACAQHPAPFAFSTTGLRARIQGLVTSIFAFLMDMMLRPAAQTLCVSAILLLELTGLFLQCREAARVGIYIVCHLHARKLESRKAVCAQGSEDDHKTLPLLLARRHYASSGQEVAPRDTNPESLSCLANS